MLWLLARILLGLVVCFVWATRDILWRIFKPLFSPSPLMDLKGPKGGNIITGQIAGAPSNGAEPDIWFLRVSEKYGPVTVIRAPWNTCMLWTCDHKAMSHILVNSDLYHRPDYARWWFGTFVGRGVIIAHGESHSRQRRIMNPAFGVSPIKQMTEVFVDKTLDLCDVFRSLIDKEQHHSGGAENGSVKNNDSVVLDMSLWLGRAALDMMTIICFQINLDVLGTGSHSQGKGPGDKGEEQKERGRESDELYPALEELFGTNDLNFSLLFWKSWIPLVRLWTLDESSHKIERCHGMIRTLAKKLIKEREKEILAGSVDEETRDLLTLLTRATMEKVNKDRMMSLDEACEQISTYFVAGQETSAAAVTWGLHSLSNDQAVQTRLREELDTVGTDHPTKEQLDGLPYLDLVVREMLRLHSPGAWIEREATKDDVIPFEKPFTDRHGNVRQHLPISKGDWIRISIRAINCQEEVWGPDAREFNPERWRDPPKAVSTMPGLIQQQMSFSTGPKSCIGYKFGLMQMKAMIFCLIRAFEFEPAIPKEMVIRRSLAVSRPMIKGQVNQGTQLPMRIRRRVR